MKKTSQRSLLFRHNVNRTEEEWRRACSRHGRRGMRTRLRPRRRAVDRAAMRSDGNNFRQLALRREIAWDVEIVGLWECGIMRLWDYGNGARRFQFQNSIMVLRIPSHRVQQILQFDSQVRVLSCFCSPSIPQFHNFIFP